MNLKVKHMTKLSEKETKITKQKSGNKQTGADHEWDGPSWN